ncbi:MAG: DUF1501 domain-containing protein [Verrucomicrobia bacterium]|nr:DUF1501 domain-containing protein [Verrucomicrobiota bacterium]MDA1005588.1 DUF1501 domain-containing protein [Verrucomicrobiota bacterium]
MSIESPTRRQFLGGTAGGLAGMALQSVLANGEFSIGMHHRPKAKRVVQLFIAGAGSHVDMFDYKPLLEKDDGKPWDPGEKVELFQSNPGKTMRSPWEFTRHGGCGKMLSEIVAPLGEVVDEISFVHNLVGKTGVHSQGMLLQSTGFNRPGFPSAGAWVSHALGSANENLPAFVVLPDHRGYPSNGVKNWSSAFLSAAHQGTVIQPGADPPIVDLFPSGRGGYLTPDSEREGLALLRSLNGNYAAARPGDDRLRARLASYELAARMQLSATDALDVSGESQATKDLYGLSPDGPAVADKEINAVAEAEFFGRKCLIARRLLERGVRFVQVWSGADNAFPRRNWDSHEDVKRDHGPLALGMSTGAAALIKDLKQRGMLEDTIVHWTTEFGRMPCAQSGKGRDHNPFVFTNWLAGGGVRGGLTLGESDQWGFKPEDPSNPTEVYDIYATMLHLLGIDHTRLTVRADSIDRRLTDVHGRVLTGLL